MKVLVLTNLYPPHALGGYELSCRDVVRRWRARGHDVHILTTSTRFRGVGDDTADADEPQVHRELEWYWADHELQRPPPRERLRLERANRRRLAARLAALRPDVVSLWAMGGMSMSLVSLCLERRQPAVAVVEDEWLGYAPHIDAWLSAWARRPRWLAALGAAVSGVPTRPPQLPAEVPVAFASDYLRRRAQASAGVGFRTAHLVPLGIDPTDFPAREAGDRPWRGRLVCVGRVEPRKGFDTVIRALPELPGASVELVGPANGHLADLQALAAELGVADRVGGRVVAREQLAQVYADADVLVFPSRWEEPFGLVPLEAMSQATPVVATRRGGSAEFLTDQENCLAVPVDDPAAIAAAVRRLEADPALRQRLREAGLRTAARYDVARFAERLEELHRNAAGGA